MEVYIGRHPILDRDWNTEGYELLFRSSKNNFCEATDDLSAIPDVIANAGLAFGLDRLIGDRPTFVKFDRTLLLGDWTACLAPDRFVIEILNTVPPVEQTLSACRRLRQGGYALALNDCLDDRRTEEFAPFVDVLKVDSRQATPAEQESLVRRYRDLRMVAAKVETEAEFKTASQLGYHYFQGFFFTSATVLQTSRVPASQIGGLRLLKEIQRDELDFDAVEALIRRDISFSHALLTYLNSAAFRWTNPVESVRQGLILLGSDQIRKWVWMAGLSSMGQNRPPVLMAQVLMRGRFCEEIAGAANLHLGDADPFLAGMFSLLDAILRRPLGEILSELNIGRSIRKALLGTGEADDSLSCVLAIVKSWELGDFHAVDAAARAIHLSPDELNSSWLRSLSWVDTVHSADERTWRAAHPSPLSGFHRNAESPPVEKSLV
jgi:c-di-GMP-related signal transduction protein